jgi:hypothetical protein
MTNERAQAYGRVVKTLDDMGPAKLHDLERQRIRNAADTLVFSAPGELDALDALADIESLARDLADSGRWTGERAGQLADDVAACGPALVEEELPLAGRAA